MKKRCWLCLLLAVFLIAQLAVIPAGAVEPTQPVCDTGIPFRSNPRCREVKIEPTAALQVNSGESTDVAVQSTPSVESIEAAAKEVRKFMKARQESFSICLTWQYAASKKLIEDIMNQALEHTGDPKEGDYLAWQFAEWSGSVKSSFWPWGYEHTITFKVTYYTTAEQEAQVDTAVAQLLTTLNVSGKSNYEKIKAVYSYLCNNVTYDHDNLNNDAYLLKHTAYAALVDKKAVCQGYSLLMYRLLLELGVDNRMIIGISSGGDHAWNIAKIGDLYYNLDATWDAGQSQQSFFLRNRENFVDHLRYLEYETLAFHKSYPMSATDYAPGAAAKVDPVIAGGMCGTNAYWQLNRDGSLTITGTGAIKDYPYGSNDQSLLAPWEFWETEITKVTVGEGITEIGEYNFCEMTSLTSVSLPGTLERIGRDAFMGATALKSIAIPAKVKTIGIGAFDGCKELTSITLPNSVTQIGTSCFRDCEKLKTVVLGTGLTELGMGAFNGCKELEEIEIPQGVKRITERTFEYCSSLKEITIPSGVTEVGVGVFQHCTSLEKVVFEGSPTLGLDLFDYNDGALKRVYFRSDAPEFHVRTFSGVTATCYYPKDNSTWTSDVMQDYCGVITWVASCGSAHTVVKDEAVAATCTKAGLTEGSHCSACGEVLTPQKTVPALGHTFGQWKQVKAPSVSEEGTEQRICSRCGTKESRSIAKLEPPVTTAPPEATAPPETTAPPVITAPPETTAPPVTTTPPETTVPPETETPGTQPTTHPTEPSQTPTTQPTQPGTTAPETPRSVLPVAMIVGVLILLGGAATVWFFVIRKRK